MSEQRDWTLDHITYVQRGWVRADVDVLHERAPGVMEEARRLAARTVTRELDLGLRGLSIEPRDMQPREVERDDARGTVLYEWRWHPTTDAVRIVGDGQWNGQHVTWQRIGEPLRLPGPRKHAMFVAADYPVPEPTAKVVADLVGWDPVERAWLYEVGA